jgi:multidrug efflux pump subunit AcrB
MTERKKEKIIMKAIFKFFAERHLLANLLTIMILILGGVSAFRINRSVFPEIDFGMMSITTYYPGASPEDVELNVTNRIEAELKSVTGIEQMTSTSMENISIVMVTIDPDVRDQEKVKNEIREAVARVSGLPREVTESPQVAEESIADPPMMEFGITGDMPYAELREYARLFEKKLKEIPGVAHINRIGWRSREIQVEVSPEKMMKYQIPLRDVIAAIQARNIRASGGTLESYTSEKNVVTLAQFRDPVEVGNVIVRSTFEGAMVRVRDLAIIRDDFEEERVITRINGKTTITFEIMKKENADLIKTVAAIKAFVEEEKAQLPADSPIDFAYGMDASKYVSSKFEIVQSNGLWGLGLVIIMLAFFLNIRSSLWVAMGIPFSLLGVLIIFLVFGMDLDAVTLFAMAIVIGIIVDDAIVISENIFQRREKGDTPLEAAVNGIHEVYLPVLTTITTTLLVFLPMFFMKGTLGKFVFVIPLAVIAALVMSMFESFFLLPAHIMPSLKAHKTVNTQSFGRAWFHPVKQYFEQITHTTLQLRYVVVVVAVLVLAGSLTYAVKFMGFVLFPTGGADEFYVVIELPIGSSLQATSDQVRKIETILNGLPEEELESYSFWIGTNYETEAENNAILDVNHTPYGTHERTADEIVEELRTKTAQLTGIEKLTFGIESGGPPTGKPIEIRVIGSDNTLRTQLVDEIVSFLNNMKGVKDIDRSDKPGKEEVAIHVDDERLARYGLTVADIAQNVRIAYDGEVVTSTRYGEEDVDFRVIVEKAFRQNLDYLRQLHIPNQIGEFIALDEVASLEIGPGDSVFQHYEGERVTTITGDVFQETVTPLDVVKAVRQQFDVKDMYPGIRIDVGGEAEESHEAMIDLAITFGLAALGIYFLLMLLFNSLTQPLMVIVAIPFGICGVIIAFALHGEPLSFSGMLGVIGMAGVVVNDSLVLVDYLNRLIRNDAEGALAEKSTLIQLIAAGTADRLRPIILTSLTTVAGLLPLAYGFGGQDIHMSPMALALGYGLLFATPITLVLVPSLYLIGHDIRRVFVG